MGDPNWSLLELEGVRDVALQAAKRIANRYESIDQDEMQQEALVQIATTYNLYETIQRPEPQLGLLQYRLEQVLTMGIRTELRRAALQIPLGRIEGDDEFNPGEPPFTPLPPLAADYTREAIEELLPAVWDESYSYGMPAKKTIPDPDMPKGSSNKAQGSSLSAYIADIKTGWERAPLTKVERRAVFLTYGAYWTQSEIAQLEGVSQRGVGLRLYTGIGKIVARLNGGIWHEAEEAVAA